MRKGFKVVLRIPKNFPDYGKGNCVYCGAILPPLKRRYCCENHAKKYRLDTRKYDIIDWANFKSKIILRDNHTCQDCGYQNTYKNIEQHRFLDVHHIVPIHNGGDEWDESNLVTLCKSCHIKRHRKQYQEPRKNQMQLDIEC